MTTKKNTKTLLQKIIFLPNYVLAYNKFLTIFRQYKCCALGILQRFTLSESKLSLCKIFLFTRR